MALNLVEDSEAFEAALHFVDEFVASDVPADQRHEDDAALALALDGLPSPTELALAESQDDARDSLLLPALPQISAPAAKTSPKSKATKGSKPKRPLNYNPNRAREQQRKELLYLREKVVEMEQELKTLQGTRRPKVEENNEKDGAVSSAELAIGALRVTRSAREAILLVSGYPHPPVPLYAV
ncbi:hypothetical protein PC116_g25714 [Phytophthora cactorum]|uniref:Uncharacterized protein n=1 Tax=Phytophthora cactorum TaxID=29920 RepID=A0A8T0Y8G8_9STRA|nr:hypothetical protein PC113_g21471 [Phytophthora cactorum]KAG2998867.1 hypothetical protein PC120_g21044 [Phytophthora cactorum]KAG3050884.1 hypothetical protein PC121_g18140 [Phytophthora cactorum]KAG4225873.1 hypothetical protein PC116_g25714 [Phytophthora cactorum]